MLDWETQSKCSTGYAYSRLGETAVHDLGCLDIDDAGDAVRMMLEACQVDQRDVDVDWPRWLAKLSDGWPQHLHNGMRSLASELVKTEGKLADVDASAVLEREHDFRSLAYSRRISSEMDRARYLVRDLMREIPTEGMDRLEIMEFIASLSGMGTSIGWRLPKGMDAEDFVEHLLHRGVLQRVGRPGKAMGTEYRCPIPSLQSYLRNEGDLDPSSLSLPLLRHRATESDATDGNNA